MPLMKVRVFKFIYRGIEIGKFWSRVAESRVRFAGKPIKDTKNYFGLTVQCFDRGCTMHLNGA